MSTVCDECKGIGECVEVNTMSEDGVWICEECLDDMTQCYKCDRWGDDCFHRIRYGFICWDCWEAVDEGY